MIQYKYFFFHDLKNNLLYEILRLRSQVFIVEQQCIYQDLDGLDSKAIHVIALSGNRVVGHSRIIGKGIKYEEFSSIGRLVLDEEFRGANIGTELMNFSIKTCLSIYPNVNIKISAQSYLKKFYEKLGFYHNNENYLEDGIQHCSMYLNT